MFLAFDSAADVSEVFFWGLVISASYNLYFIALCGT